MNAKLNITDIRSWCPCYNPNRYLPEDWKGSVKGILRHRDIPAKDKLWVVLRNSLLNNKTLRLFAVACARRALARSKNPDPRYLKACDISEDFANGIATREELVLVATAATAATHTVTNVAACAAYAAAPNAWYAAVAAAVTTANSAAYNDDAAAYTAERKWQVNKLLEMLGG